MQLLLMRSQTFLRHILQKYKELWAKSFNNIARTFYKLNDEVVNIIDLDVLEETIKKAHFEENTTNYSELFPQDEEALCVLQKDAMI